MNNSVYRQLRPYLAAILAIVVSIFVLVLFFHILVVAVVIGAILFALSALRGLITNKKNTSKHKPVIYEHGEY